MPTKGRIFAGCTVALVTPFRAGAVDEEGLRRLVEWHITQGTPVLSPVGTTGESPTLSHEEHERVIAVGVSTIAFENTAQLETIQALAASQMRYRALVETLTEFVLVTDESGAVGQPQPSWSGFTGQSDGAAAGWRLEW